MPSTFVLLYSVFNVLVGGDNRNRTDGLLLARQALSQLSYTPMWRVQIRFYRSPFKKLVGSNGLEPSTSRLSGARSNHLSYEPIPVSVSCSLISSLQQLLPPKDSLRKYCKALSKLNNTKLETPN